MPGERYLFIDGNYLTQGYCEAMTSVCGIVGKLDLEIVRESLHAQKAFYYDCLDDLQRESEDSKQFEARLSTQKEFFARLQQVPGCHFRPGRLVGEGKRRRQKGVDVRLAVDMLHHAFRSNMSHAVLIAGDADFKPLVEALVDLGTWVEILSFKNSTSEELKNAADSWSHINAGRLTNWSGPIFQQRFLPFPFEQGFQPTPECLEVATSQVGSTEYVLLSAGGSYVVHSPASMHGVICQDRERLQKYVKHEYGIANWKSRHS